MACSILEFYVSEEESTCSVDEVNPTLKIKKKPKKSGKLSTGSRWLFEKIQFLSKKTGYFYGSNEYLAKHFCVDTRTIQRWLECLKNHALISVELTKKNGFETSRKIYVISNISYTRQDCRPRHDRIAVQNESYKEENMNDSEALQSSSSFLKSEQAKASPKQNLMLHYNNWCEKFGIKINPIVYRSWRKKDSQMDFETSYVSLTLKKLHEQYSKQNPSKEFSEKELECALSRNYYHLCMPDSWKVP